MKKILCLLISGYLLAGGIFIYPAVGDCRAGEKDPVRIVVTCYPEYDWVMNVLGDNPAGAEVILLVDNGVDIHSYQPSAEDILTISTSDLFIYVGGVSDAWVADALKEALNEDMIVIDLLEVLGDAAREEETPEGMQGDDHEEAGTEYDEHVWLSVRNASLFADSITEAVRTLDPDHSDVYAENAAVYKQELSRLDTAYEEAVSQAPVSTLVFGDRFPFRYLTDDYGLTYYAAFNGCSAETEASFETIAFLADKIDELSLRYVITIEGSDQRIAQTIVQSTKSRDQQILTMDSMQGTTEKDIEDGVSYLSVMEKNLEILKTALS